MIQIETPTDEPQQTNGFALLTVIHYTTGWTMIIEGANNSYTKYEHSFINTEEAVEQVSVRVFKLSEDEITTHIIMENI